VARARRYAAAVLLAAATAQWQVLAATAAEVSAAEGARPSGLGDWTIGELLAHVTAGIRATSRGLAGTGPSGPPISLPDYLGAASTVADMVAARARELAAGRSAAELAATLQAEATAATAAVDYVLTRNPGQNVVSRLGTPSLSTPSLGTLSLTDWLVTRLVEAVVHSLDLGRALDCPVALEPAAVRPATQALADLLAIQAPGPTVEVRIPPYAAAQCVAGPRHTRGTPPNVVEFASPAGWLRVATGRTSWSAAVAAGDVRASGERSDLARYLPVLR